MSVEKSNRFITQLGLFLAIALYIAVRFWGLTDSCLWFDEIFSIHAANHHLSDAAPIPGLLDFVAQDLIHPPLFYLLLKFWIFFADGESLLWLRLFPVFFSILALLPLLLLCRELKFTTLEKTTAITFLAVNGSLIKYSQEVRMYSVLSCLSLFSIWLFARFLNTTRKSTFFWLFFVNLLLVYTHYFGWLVVVSEVFAVLLWRREFLKRFIAGFLFLAICFAPWAFAVLNAAQSNTGLKQNIGWAAKPGLAKLLSFIFSLHEPFYYQQHSLEAPNLLLISLPFAFVCISAMIFALCVEKETFVFRLLAVFVIVPVFIAFIASWLLPYSVWGIRHLIIIFAPYSLIVALSLNRLRPIGLKIGAFCLLGLLIFAGCAFHFGRTKNVNIWCGWEELAKQAIEKEVAFENLTVYAFEDLVAYHLWFATKYDQRINIVAVKDFPGIEEDKAYFLPRGFEEVKIMDKNAIAGDQFWIAFRSKIWNPSHPLIQDLTMRGYKFGKPLEFKAGPETAFLVKFKK
ncbi:MAG: hypothetical protein M3209_02825 [Acidobacteriota bacterium]|nr:hypothetical protein [Acidobacteriota bacterium]